MNWEKVVRLHAPQPGESSVGRLVVFEALFWKAASAGRFRALLTSCHSSRGSRI